MGTRTSLTPDDVLAARKAAGLTQTAAAAILGKPLRTWQNWEAPVGAKNHRAMDPALFKLFKQEVAAAAGRIAPSP